MKKRDCNFFWKKKLKNVINQVDICEDPEGFHAEKKVKSSAHP